MAKRNGLQKLLLLAAVAMLIPVVGFATDSIAASFIVGALGIAVATALLLEWRGADQSYEFAEPERELPRTDRAAAPMGEAEPQAPGRARNRRRRSARITS
jgi:hypothetical protein